MMICLALYVPWSLYLMFEASVAVAVFSMNILHAITIGLWIIFQD